MPGRVIAGGGYCVQAGPVRHLALIQQPAGYRAAGILHLRGGLASGGISEDCRRRLTDGAGLAFNPDDIDGTIGIKRQAERNRAAAGF